MLLAVDLGLKTAWALYDSEGRLQRYESRNFGTRSRFRTGVVTVVRTLPMDVAVIVAEGDRHLARIWFDCRLSWETELVAAERWRSKLLWKRQRRSGSQAKEVAKEIAAKIIKDDRCGWSTRLNDDTAEAILLGYWAVTERGWRYGEALSLETL